MPLTDEQWLLVEPLLQQAESSGLPVVGRPPSDSRQALDAVLHKLSTGCPWYDLPFDSLSYQTAYRRYRVWRDAGLLSEILRLLADDLHHRGGLDITQIFRNREFYFTCDRGRRTLVYPDQWRATWQLDTALVLIGYAVQIATRAVHRSRRRG